MRKEIFRLMVQLESCARHLEIGESRYLVKPVCGFIATEMILESQIQMVHHDLQREQNRRLEVHVGCARVAAL